MESKQIAGYSLAGAIILLFLYLYFSFIPNAKKVGDPHTTRYNVGLIFMILWLGALLFISTPVDDENMEKYQHYITWGLIVIFIAPLALLAQPGSSSHYTSREYLIIFGMAGLAVLQGWIGLNPNEKE